MKLTWTKLIFVSLLAAVVVQLTPSWAGSIKTWSSAETLTASDLNANFAHVHAQSEAEIVNADVSSSAAISHEKLATPALLPKAWALVKTTCSGDPCTITESSGISAVNWSATGSYTATLSYGNSDADVGVLITALRGSATNVFCQVTDITGSVITFVCSSDASADTDTGFSILVMDADKPI